MTQSKWRAKLFYRLLSLCALPVVLAHLLWRSWHDGGSSYLLQRLGFSLPTLSRKTAKAIWIHAASVGEVNTAAPLIHCIAQRYPTCALLVTTNTPTGKAALERAAIDNTTHAYLPLDYTFAIKRFLQSNAIRCGIIIETEIWPQLFDQSPFPLAIVNGRLSARTLRVTKRGMLAAVYRQAVSNLEILLARSEVDANAFIELGVSRQQVSTLGNLKFAATQGVSAGAEVPGKPLPRDYCLLASTHDDEELQLATLWLRQQCSELLVIAPRHPDRRNSIIKQLNTLQVKLCVRSRDDAVDQDTRIYLADTLGEMPLWFAHAQAIFMGGSVVKKGGHNMLEPAQLGRAVVTGPYMENFAEELAEFVAADAIVQVNSADEVIAALMDVLNSPSEADARGARAQDLIERNQLIAHRYLAALSPLLDVSGDSAR